MKTKKKIEQIEEEVLRIIGDDIGPRGQVFVLLRKINELIDVLNEEGK